MPEGLALDQLHSDVVLAVAGFTERERAALYKLDRRGGKAWRPQYCGSNGHAAALTRLAMCHLNGVGVERRVAASA